LPFSYSRAAPGPIASRPCAADNQGLGYTADTLATFDQETPMTPTTTATHDVISSDRVEGASVYDTAGEKLGSIDELMIDKHSGQVRYAVMEFGGFLGMNTDRYPLPWNMLKYDTTKDGYVVPLDKAKLKDAPRYNENDLPAYTPEYGQRVNNYYGTDL
jgi:sporulation protein YlmC with PRC-barrel domain